MNGSTICADLVFNPFQIVTNPHVVVFLSVKAGVKDQSIVMRMLLPRSQAGQLPFSFNFYENWAATIAISRYSFEIEPRRRRIEDIANPAILYIYNFVVRLTKIIAM